MCDPVEVEEFVEIGGEDGGRYELCGVIVHAGKSSNSGHYYSIVRRDGGHWYLCNDGSVSYLGT